MKLCRSSVRVARNIRVLPVGAGCLVVWAMMIAWLALPDLASVEAATGDEAAQAGVQEHRYAVSSQYVRWFDRSRNRAIPCKIYSPRSDDEAFPVIVFSHGLGGSRETCAYLGRHWASRGYVSIHLQHVGSDEELWRGKPLGRVALREAYRRPSTGYSRPLDVSFVLDQLEKMHESKTTLGRKLDLGRIGVAGNDFGAQAGLLLAGQKSHYGSLELGDARVQAVVAMSPPVLPTRYSYEERFGSVGVACMHITSTHDDGIIGTTRAYQRRIPFDHIDGADQFLVTLQGADHMVYRGHILERNRDGDAYYQRIIRNATTLFWNAYLKDDARGRSELAEDEGASLLSGGARLEAKIASAELVSAASP